MQDYKTIIEENKKRVAILNSPYNPVTGLGSPIEREEISFLDTGSLYLPIEMVNESEFTKKLLEFNSFGKFASSLGVNINIVQELFINERFLYDFEYWAFSTIKIKPKKEDGSAEDLLSVIPFTLNQPQRKILKELEKMRAAGVPIRLILLKARQLGGSTLIQIYISWIQFIHRLGWNSIICTEVESQAANIRSMYTRLVKHYPKDIANVKLSNFEGTTKNKYYADRDCVISIGSAEKPDTLRSGDVRAAHLSEIGLWKKTLQKSPEDLVQSLEGTIPEIPYSFIAKESTAKGEGNYFHVECLRAIAGKTNYVFVFVSWFDIEKYQKKIKNHKEFIESLSPYEESLWDLGATLEGICWYRDKRRSFKDEWRMFSEFPSTPEEAFQSSGQKFFPLSYIKNMDKYIKEPKLICNVHSKSMKGDEAFKDIEFHKANDGRLKIWKMPEKIIEIAGKKYTIANRYCGFGDIGGSSITADPSALKILDRKWMLWGGVPEVAAVWHGICDQDLFAWEAAKVCYAYDKALLAIETNFMNKTENTEGTHFFTVLDQIKDYYPNLFIRNVQDSTVKDWQPKYGFHMGANGDAGKGMICDSLKAALREESYYERDFNSINEFKWFETKPNGKLGNIDGKHDDLVIVTAGSYWMSDSYMDPPFLIPWIDPKDRKHTSKNIVGPATF